LNGNFFYLAVKNDISVVKIPVNTDATSIAGTVGGIVGGMAVATIVVVVICYRLRRKRKVHGNPVSKRYEQTSSYYSKCSKVKHQLNFKLYKSFNHAICEIIMFKRKQDVAIASVIAI